MKVAVIGGGSSYTPELINGFLERHATLPISELWLMDVRPERLAVVGQFAQRMAAAAGSPFRVILTTDQRAAIQGAQYVTTQLRVGWMQARREDEYLGRRHGLVGQETTGVGGMAKALRTIPVILQIARDMAELAPGALLVNFTNPAGLVTEALARYAPDVASVGVCNVPLTAKMDIIAGLNASGLTVDPARARLDTLGLNHLTWHRGFTVDGEDVWPQILSLYAARLRSGEEDDFDPDTVETLRMIPNYYLRYYYYTQQVIASQQAWERSRAEEVMLIEQELFAQYAEPDRTHPPDGLMKRGGAYYSTVATQLLNAHYNDLNEEHVVNVRHNGAVAGWPSDWVLELPCRIGRAGVQPIPTEPLPLACYGLLSQVKAYEILTAQAAAEGRYEAAYEALLVHPLGPSADRVKAVLDDMIATHQLYLDYLRRGG
ncbi:6-phospho-beta-glucosidase (plasmid) [Aggregatilineales bacterium SYSU G02658]